MKGHNSCLLCTGTSNEACPLGLKSVHYCSSKCFGLQSSPLLRKQVPSPALSSDSFAGKCGLGRDHVLPLLPAHSRQTHPHGDQVSQSQGDGHHRLLRYLPLLPQALSCGLPEVQTVGYRRVFRKKGQELTLFLGGTLPAFTSTSATSFLRKMWFLYWCSAAA